MNICSLSFSLLSLWPIGENPGRAFRKIKFKYIYIYNYTYIHTHLYVFGKIVRVYRKFRLFSVPARTGQIRKRTSKIECGIQEIIIKQKKKKSQRTENSLFKNRKNLEHFVSSDKHLTRYSKR